MRIIVGKPGTKSHVDGVKGPAGIFIVTDA